MAHSLLEKLLKKRGIESIAELKTGEGKEEFDQWNKILSSEGEVTVSKIREFCESQKKIIEGRWRDLDNSKEKNERLILLHTVYSAIIEAISIPQKQREELEKYLQQLLDS